MKILLVGIGYRGYAECYRRALETLGHDVISYIGLKQYDTVTRIRRVTTPKCPCAT